MPDDIYDELIQPRGAAYRASQVHPRSHYLEPVEQGAGWMAGNSRVWGDANPEVQSRSIDALVDAARAAGLGSRETAHVLAIARVESGFNPDAAAGTTSASGLGQFIDDTGKAYGLDDRNRFDIDAQAGALVAHFIDNRNLAQRRGQDESWIYKYHHDGPVRDYGGLALSRDKVMPLLEQYTQFVESRFGVTQSNETRSETRVPASPNAMLMRDGQRGDDVAQLQATLTGLGYHDARDVPLQADGVFGSRTGQAVRAFQQAQGLEVDGVVGPATRDALDRALQVEKAPPRDAEAVTTSPVDQLLAAARSGDAGTLQAAMDGFAATRFGQMFQQAQVAESERVAQREQASQCSPDR